MLSLPTLITENFPSKAFYLYKFSPHLKKILTARIICDIDNSAANCKTGGLTSPPCGELCGRMPEWTVPTNIWCLIFSISIYARIAKKATSAFYIQQTSLALIIPRLIQELPFYCVEWSDTTVNVYNFCITDRLETLKYWNKVSENTMIVYPSFHSFFHPIFKYWTYFCNSWLQQQSHFRNFKILQLPVPVATKHGTYMTARGMRSSATSTMPNFVTQCVHRTYFQNRSRNR